MLKLFLVDGAANLRNGFMYVHRGFTEIAHGVFKGFLADEKGLKEFFDLKGASGTKPSPASAARASRILYTRLQRTSDEQTTM